MPRLELKKIGLLVGSLKFIRDKALEHANNYISKAIDFVDTPYFVGASSAFSLADIFFFKGSPRYIKDPAGNTQEYYMKKYSYSEIGFLAAGFGLSCFAPFINFLKNDNYKNFIIATSALGAVEIIVDASGLSAYWSQELYTRYDTDGNPIDSYTLHYSMSSPE